MFDTVVVATDGSESARRGVEVALDLAERFDAAVHALSVVSTPEGTDDREEAAQREERAERALADVTSRTDRSVTTAVREGSPAEEILAYVRAVDADLVATGTRGRHGENRLLIGSVAESVVRSSRVPVLTVRQLADDAA